MLVKHVDRDSPLPPGVTSWDARSDRRHHRRTTWPVRSRGALCHKGRRERQGLRSTRDDCGKPTRIDEPAFVESLRESRMASTPKGGSMLIETLMNQEGL